MFPKVLYPEQQEPVKLFHRERECSVLLPQAEVPWYNLNKLMLLESTNSQGDAYLGLESCLFWLQLLLFIASLKGAEFCYLRIGKDCP